MIKSIITARTYRAIYRLLDRVSPIPFDCGTICGAACCDIDSGEDLGLFLIPGEDKIHDKRDKWLEWNTLDTDDYDLPESWDGKVFFVRCRGAEHCQRTLRPIQCRTFPLMPRITNDGLLELTYNDNELTYCCPLIEDQAELDECFVKATYTVWTHLIRDPLIYDMVRQFSD